MALLRQPGGDWFGAQRAGDLSQVLRGLDAAELNLGGFEAGRDSETLGFVGVGSALEEALQVSDVGFVEFFVDGLLGS